MKIGALIESRSTSTRLPGKVNVPITNEHTMSELIYARVNQAKRLDCISFVIPHEDIQSCIYDEQDIPFLEGPPNNHGDVMMELSAAAFALNLTHIVEITGDCACIDAGVIDWVVEEYEPDYTGWTEIKGMEARMFSRAALDAAVSAVHDWRRNGSTIFYRIPEWRARILTRPTMYREARRLNFSVDDEGDLEFVREIYRRVPWNASMNKILEVAEDITGESRAESTTTAQRIPSTS